MKRLLLILVPAAAVAAVIWRANNSRSSRPARFDPLLALRGSGRGLYGTDPVEYVRRLREG